MQIVAQLLGLWRYRLARIDELAAEDATPTGGEWLWKVRARILKFLVSRYSDPAAMAREEALYELVPQSLDAAQFDIQPVHVGPKTREALRQSLHAIHDSNFESWRKRRWRWFI